MSAGYVTGPVIIENIRPDSEATGPQVHSIPIIDSRLSPYRRGNLTPTRIREIRNDPTVSFCRQVILAPMIHTPWVYKTREGGTEEMVEFVQQNFECHRDWLLQDALFGALDFGWQPFEVVYEPKDGEIRIQKFKKVLQDYTCIVVAINDGDFAGFINQPIHSYFGDGTTSGPGIMFLKPYAMNINLEVEGTDWYGRPVSEPLDPIVTAWDEVEKSATRYDKKVAGATWVVYYPVGETNYNGQKDVSNHEIALNILNTLQASGGVAVPDEIQEFMDEDSIDVNAKGKWRIELIHATGSTQSTFTDRQKYLDNLKTRCFGIPERAILEGKFGTKAESEVQADVALSTIDTKHRLILDQINQQSVNGLLRLNYGEEFENAVYIEPAPLIDSHYQTIKEIYRLIIQSPELSKLEIENIDVGKFRQLLNVPEAEGASDTLEVPEPQPVPAAFGGPQNPEDPEEMDTEDDDVRDEE